MGQVVYTFLEPYQTNGISWEPDEQIDEIVIEEQDIDVEELIAHGIVEEYTG